MTPEAAWDGIALRENAGASCVERSPSRIIRNASLVRADRPTTAEQYHQGCRVYHQIRGEGTIALIDRQDERGKPYVPAQYPNYPNTV